MAGNGDFAGFVEMPELPVASHRTHMVPPVVMQQSKHISHLH